MWISKKKWNEMEKKITALEKEQLYINELIKSNLRSNENLLDYMKDFREELKMLEANNADVSE